MNFFAHVLHFREMENVRKKKKNWARFFIVAWSSLRGLFQNFKANRNNSGGFNEGLTFQRNVNAWRPSDEGSGSCPDVRKLKNSKKYWFGKVLN